MTIICNAYISTRDLSYHADLKCFTVEESTLRGGRQNKRYLSAVYDDACDEGFVLVSHKTGDSVVCALHEVEMDRSGEDIAGWRYKVVALQGKRPGQWKQLYKEAPAPYNFTVLIIND